MNGRRAGLVGVLAALALVLGVKFYGKHHLSSQVRDAMYERYSNLGTPEDVRKAVAGHHDQAFDECYRMGWKRTKTQFEADRYADLMDRAVRPVLESIITQRSLEAQRADGQRRLETLEARQTGSEAFAAEGTAPEPAAGLPAAAATHHDIAITAVNVRTASGSETQPGDSATRQYVVEVLAADPADGIRPGHPPSATLDLRCGSGEVVSQPAQPSAVKAMGPGKSLTTIPLFVSEPLIPGTGCEVTVSLRDDQGNASPVRVATFVIR